MLRNTGGCHHCFARRSGGGICTAGNLPADAGRRLPGAERAVAAEGHHPRGAAVVSIGTLLLHPHAHQAIPQQHIDYESQLLRQTGITPAMPD